MAPAERHASAPAESASAAAAAATAEAEAALGELMRELSARPLRTDVRVAVEVAGQPAYTFLCGQLLRCTAADDEARTGAAAPSSDACISFRDRAALDELVLRFRGVLSTDDLPRVVSSLLCELAMPTWGYGPRAVEVTGAGALARALWCACFSREEQQAPRRQGWADEDLDLSQGWVMVHSVSPGIRERVAMFQQELAQVPRAPGNQEDTPDVRASWLDELIEDLCVAAERFQDTARSSVQALSLGDDAGVPADDGGAPGDGTGQEHRQPAPPPASAQCFL